jgi:hypothetical protein
MTCLRRHLDRKETKRAHLPLSPHTSNPRSLFRARERGWEGWSRETPPNPRPLFHLNLTHIAPPHNKRTNLKPQSTSGKKQGGKAPRNKHPQKTPEKKRKKHLVSLHAGGAKRTNCGVGGGKQKKKSLLGVGARGPTAKYTTNIQALLPVPGRS